MHKIKDRLMDSIYEIEEKIEKSPTAPLSLQDIEKIQKITDTIKNIDKIDMLEGDGGYSEESKWMGKGQIYGTSYDGESSYRGRGRNAKRDSMGRYSRDGYSMDDGKEEMIERLEGMMHDADPKSRDAIKRCISAIENA